MSNDLTMVRLEKDVVDRLKLFGIKGETYNDIVKRLMGQGSEAQKDSREDITQKERFSKK